jgi:chromosome segregation ATPase
VTSEQQSRFEVLVEDMQSSLRTIAEATVANTQAIDQLRAEISGTNNRLDTLVIKVDVIDRRLEQIDQRFEQVDQRFEQVDQRFEQVDQRFEQVDQRFERIESHLQVNGAPKRSRKPAARKKR